MFIRNAALAFASFQKATKRERLERKVQQLIKFLTFRSVHPPCLPDPPFRYFEGLVPRLHPRLIQQSFTELADFLCMSVEQLDCVLWDSVLDQA